METMKRVAILMAAVALPAMLLISACGDDDDDTTNGGGDQASGAHVEATNASAKSPGNDVASVYVTLTNHADAPDYLISAEILGDKAGQVGMVQIHEVVTEGATSKMQEVEKVEIPAKGELQLKAGSYHIMLMNVDPPLAEGDELEVKLNFENADPVTVKATVGKPGQDMGATSHN